VADEQKQAQAPQQQPKAQPQQPKPAAQKPGQPQAAPKPVHKELKSTAKEGVRGILRIAGKDVDGGLAVRDAISRVKGIGSTLAVSLSRVIEEQLKLDASAPIGSLTDQQIEQIEELMKHPGKYGVPAFLLNRQRDDDTGAASHLVMNELAFASRQDIQKEKEMKTWIGWRHSIGQKVRGQRNRTTGRSGMTVGVMKKALKAAKTAAASSAQEAGKKETK